MYWSGVTGVSLSLSTDSFGRRIERELADVCSA
jgi:hypothetical protein